jgi:hydroxymethylglutaryl-CoA reductase
MKTSRFPGFYKRTPLARREAVAEALGIPEQQQQLFDAGSLSIETADVMVENVIGTFGLPLATAVNFLCNGKDVLVPMVVEEPSVVAAVSNMARLTRPAGGFQATSDPSVMIGQIQLMEVADPARSIGRLQAEKSHLKELAASIHPRLSERGGGLRSISFRQVRYDEPGEVPEDMVVVHFHLDCVDAMGANMVNTIAERLAPEVERITGERVGLRILSNYATERLASASCRVPTEMLGTQDAAGEKVAAGIVNASRFAYADPWRAATHNKGVMNGIDAIAIATGNDWRAIEAGAHAWAARSGQYRSLTKWSRTGDGDLLGSIQIPMQVGTVGGPIQSHPQVAANLRILGNPRARELAALMAMVGLAQNMAALRALATEGIQRGHMRMHARQIAIQAGAVPAEVGELVKQMSSAGEYSIESAKRHLLALRNEG